MSRQKRYVKLTALERSALDKGFRKSKKPTFRQRCHYILLSDQGHDIQQIASFYQVSRQRVARWMDRYEAQGIDGLHTQTGQGLKPLLRTDNTEHVELVKQLVKEHPQDLKPVLAQLEQRLGIKLGTRTLQRFLKKLLTDGNVFGA